MIFNPTPICNGVKGKLVDNNSNGFTLLLVARVSIGVVSLPTSLVLFSTCSLVVTLTSTTKILTNKGTISKHVPSLNGLIGFVVTIACSFYS